MNLIYLLNIIRFIFGQFGMRTVQQPENHTNQTYSILWPSEVVIVYTSVWAKVSYLLIQQTEQHSDICEIVFLGTGHPIFSQPCATSVFVLTTPEKHEWALLYLCYTYQLVANSDCCWAGSAQWAQNSCLLWLGIGWRERWEGTTIHFQDVALKQWAKRCLNTLQGFAYKFHIVHLI